MAVNSFSSAQISLQKYGSFLKYASKDLKSKHCSVPQKKAPVGPVAFRITASIKNKVNNTLDVEIMNLVQQQSWLQIVKGEEINHLAKGVLRQQEDLNYNRWL
ncbi:hypothetical protein V8G54_004739 [Vigna mungo]|uniref:Uncharacterized protein n=1 Tax=Vigna mungo TaxID=3915 RepID=A0AAQ3PI35_VIGMU